MVVVEYYFFGALARYILCLGASRYVGVNRRPIHLALVIQRSLSVVAISDEGIVLYRVNRLSWSNIATVRRVSVLGLPYYLLLKKRVSLVATSLFPWSIGPSKRRSLKSPNRKRQFVAMLNQRTPTRRSGGEDDRWRESFLDASSAAVLFQSAVKRNLRDRCLISHLVALCYRNLSTARIQAHQLLPSPQLPSSIRRAASGCSILKLSSRFERAAESMLYSRFP